MSYATRLLILQQLVDNEHGGCAERHCDLRAAMLSGYGLWAVQLHERSGGASSRFLQRFSAFMARYGERFISDSEAERNAMCEVVASQQCPDCNAVSWQCEDEFVERCDCCLAAMPESPTVCDCGKVTSAPVDAACDASVVGASPL